VKVTVKKTRVLLDLSNREVEALAELFREIDRSKKASPLSWLMLKKAPVVLLHEQIAGLLAAFTGSEDFAHGPLADEELGYAPAFVETLKRVQGAMTSVRGRWKGEKGTQSKTTVEAHRPRKETA